MKVASGPIPETIDVGDSIKFGTLYMDGYLQDARYTNTYSVGASFTFGNTSGNQSITWYKVSDTLLVADRVIVAGMTWDTLNANDLVFGKIIRIDGFTYRTRLLTGGSYEGDSNNEWDRYMTNGPVSRYSWSFTRDGSYTQTTLQDGSNSFAVVRGTYNIDSWYEVDRSSTNGYRPVLEILADGEGDDYEEETPSTRTPESIYIGESIRFGTLFVAGNAVDADATTLYDGSQISFRSSCGSTYGVTDINWVKVSNSMLIADRNILKGISWNEVKVPGYMYGLDVTLDGRSYTIRSLTGGDFSYDTSDSEWDTYIINGIYPGSDYMWHWSGVASWTQNLYSSLAAVLRGNGTAYDWATDTLNNYADENGFRPCLIIN